MQRTRECVIVCVVLQHDVESNTSWTHCLVSMDASSYAMADHMSDGFHQRSSCSAFFPIFPLSRPPGALEVVQGDARSTLRVPVDESLTKACSTCVSIKSPLIIILKSTHTSLFEVPYPCPLPSLHSSPPFPSSSPPLLDPPLPSLLPG